MPAALRAIAARGHAPASIDFAARVAAFVLGAVALGAGSPAGAVEARHLPQQEAACDLQELVPALAGTLDARVGDALARVSGVDRQLLALRSYLRAGSELVQRWSWSEREIAEHRTSADYRSALDAVSRVAQRFAALNPGYALYVNVEVRSLDLQLQRFNVNEGVGRAAAALRGAFDEAAATNGICAAPPPARLEWAREFVVNWVPPTAAPLAAPGLSAHGQLRAFDFQVQRAGSTIAGPSTASTARDWDQAGWTARLQQAVSAASDRFVGPLASPREPWHYVYAPPEAAGSQLP
jgi:hypothetical protein